MDTTVHSQISLTGHPESASSQLSVRSGPVSARRQNTRDRLMGAALNVFARHGVAGASIEALCEEAGMTRGAFYSNFISLDDLILDLIDRAVSSITTDITETLGDTSGLMEMSREEFQTLGARERVAVLRRAGEQAFSGGTRVKWTDSIAWTMTEAEINLYSLRAPQLREPYLALHRTHVVTIGAEVERLLAAFGARLTVPNEELIRYLAAITQHEARQQIDAHAVAHAPVPDAGHLVAQLDGYDPATLPKNSLMRPAPFTLPTALDLMTRFIEFAD